MQGKAESLLRFRHIRHRPLYSVERRAPLLELNAEMRSMRNGIEVCFKRSAL